MLRTRIMLGTLVVSGLEKCRLRAVNVDILIFDGLFALGIAFEKLS